MAALAMQHAVELDRSCAEFADDLERLQRRIPYQHAELLQARYLLRGPCIMHAATQNFTLLHPRLVLAARPRPARGAAAGALLPGASHLCAVSSQLTREVGL